MNRLTQSVTKGTAPVVNLTVNAATNRISSPGFVYDLNGNQTQWPVGAGTATAGYDAQNRMTSISTANGTEFYGYSSANQRILIFRASGTETLFYGLGGELLGIYARTQKANGRYYVSSVIGTRVWFAGRMIESNGNAVVRDRLGSVEKNGTTLTHYYPYGEEQGGATAGNKEKFGTYTRDAVSGLDYGWNRYYSSTWGRFASADPYVMSGGLGNPQGWNRYSYVENDPVSLTDKTGLQLDQCADDVENKWNAVCIARKASVRLELRPDIPGAELGSPTWMLVPVVVPAPSPGGYSPESVTSPLEPALSLAVEALRKPECQSMFGTAQSRAGAWDPARVFGTLYSKDGGYLGDSGVYGGYKLSLWYPVGSVATVGPAFFSCGPAGLGAFGLRVDINEREWNETASISKHYAAAALLHELGHIYGALGLFGSGGSQIVYDGLSGKSSEENQSLVLKNCFGL